MYMTTFDRTWIKDQVIGELYSRVKQNHIVADHTKQNLLKNRHIKDIYEETRHFAVLQSAKPIYISYDTANWLDDEQYAVLVRIERINVYETFLEYETTRMKELHSAQQGKNIPNIN